VVVIQARFHYYYAYQTCHYQEARIGPRADGATQ
jgi:hypothetical protein